MSLVTAIAGSPSSSAKSSALLEFAACRLKQRGIRTTIVAVRDLPAEALLHARFDNPILQSAIGSVEDAQGVIVSTPVYKGAYSGALKVFLDMLPQSALQDKVVLPIVTGGSPGHQLVLDYALKPVLASLGARHIVQGVYVLDSQVQFAHGGELDLDDRIEERLLASLKEFSDVALRMERDSIPQDWVI